MMNKEVHMVRRFSLFGLWLSLVFLLAPALLWAQGSNASISGIVEDPTGAAVPNAELTLRALSTGAVAKTTSGSDGLYAFPNLLAGFYELTASARGFRDYEQKGISINLNEKVRLDVKLELGTAVQKVEVTANASPLNFENPEQKGTITPQTLEQLPLILSGHTRSAVAFARLLPGVTTGGGEDHLNFNTRVNGGINEGDEAVLDGITIIDGSLGQNGIELAVTGHPYSPEAIQEITLLTANYDPQFGSTASSVLTAVTRSGADAWHGSAYYLLRNTALNARQFGIPKRPKDIESDFGWTIGGPIKIPWLAWSGRKKTYAFANYEGFRLRGSVLAPRISVPTLQERQGDFRDWADSSGNLIPIYDPATTTIDPVTGTVTRQQFMGCDGKTPNVICPSDPRMVNSLAPGWFKYLPAPNLPGVLNNYTPPKPPTGTVNADSTVFDLRVDHYVGEKDHVAVTVHYFGSFGNNQTILSPQIAPDSFRQPNYDFANRINWDHTFRPNLLNNFNIGYNDILSIGICSDEKFADAVPKISGVESNAFPPVMGFQDFYPFGCNGRFDTTRPATIANDRLTWVRGKHTLGFGGEWRALQDKEISNSNQSGSFNFSRLNTGLRGVNSGNSIASFLLGYVDNANMSILTLTNQYIRQKYLALYGSDTWKVTPKLTLNWGVRWDVSTPSKDKYDNMSLIDPNRSNPGAGNRPGVLVFAGSKRGADVSLGRSYPEAIWYRGFAPRVGIAYAVSPNTVVRAGYGVFYQLLSYPSWSSGVSPGRDGFNSNVVFSSTEGGITPALLLQNGFTGKTFDRPPFFNVTFDNGKYPGLYREFNGGRPPYMQQYNLTVEHQYTNDFYTSTAYVANKGTRIISDVAPLNVLNPSLLSMGHQLRDEFQSGQTTLDGVPIPYSGWVEQMTQCPASVAQALLPYPQYCGNLYSLGENAGNSTYHSFQLKAEKRFSHRVWMLTSYTWSKFISSGSDIQAYSLQWTGQSGVISPFERRRNKSLDSQDVPHTLSVALVYQLPFGKGQRFLNKGGMAGSVLDKVVGGWQVTSVFRAQSGIPFWFRSSQCDIPGQFAVGCIPGILPGANPFAQSKGNFDPNKPLFNKSAFEKGDQGGVFSFEGGHGPRVSNVRGFGFHNHDFSLQKTTSITERVKFQFRAEFFNLWNWHMFTRGTTWAEAGPFGTDLASPNFGMWTGEVTTPRNIQMGAKVIF